MGRVADDIWQNLKNVIELVVWRKITNLDNFTSSPLSKKRKLREPYGMPLIDCGERNETAAVRTTTSKIVQTFFMYWLFTIGCQRIIFRRGLDKRKPAIWLIKGYGNSVLIWACLWCPITRTAAFFSISTNCRIKIWHSWLLNISKETIFDIKFWPCFCLWHEMFSDILVYMYYVYQRPLHHC